MLKLIGGILVAGSGVGLAVNMIAEIRQHLLRLYEIRQLLINISGEAALALLPMEHILNQLEIIANAGNAFFGRNIKENERMLSIYLERLDFVIEQERKEQREKQRVAGAVSVIGGMMLVILFI